MRGLPDVTPVLDLRRSRPQKTKEPQPFRAPRTSEEAPAYQAVTEPWQSSGRGRAGTRRDGPWRRAASAPPCWHATATTADSWSSGSSRCRSRPTGATRRSPSTPPNCCCLPLREAYASDGGQHARGRGRTGHPSGAGEMSRPRIPVTRFELSSAQTAFWTANERYVDFEGAVRAGKTTPALLKVTNSCVEHPGIQWLIAAGPRTRPTLSSRRVSGSCVPGRSWPAGTLRSSTTRFGRRGSHPASTPVG